MTINFNNEILFCCEKYVLHRSIMKTLLKIFSSVIHLNVHIIVKKV